MPKSKDNNSNKTRTFWLLLQMHAREQHYQVTTHKTRQKRRNQKMVQKPNNSPCQSCNSAARVRLLRTRRCLLAKASNETELQILNA